MMKKERLLFLAVLLGLGLSQCHETSSDTNPVICKSEGFYYDDSVTKAYFAGAFSPNGDCINDLYQVIANVPLTTYSLTIKDAAGTILFYTHDIQKGWNGRNLQGKVIPDYYKAYISFTTEGGQKISSIIYITLYTYEAGKDCLPPGAKNCVFPDMIDPRHGVIWPTQESFCD